MARDQSRGESVSRNSAYSFAALMIGAVFTAGLTFFLAHRLGTTGFGVLSLALGVCGLAQLPLDFGISASAARFVAEHRGDRSRVAAVIADALRVKLPVSVVIAAVLFALAEPISAAYGIPALVWTIRGLAIALIGQSVMLMTGVFAAVARVRFQLWTALTESAFEVTASLALVLAGAGATGAAFGRAVGYTAGAAMTLILIASLFGAGALPRKVRFGTDARRIATYGSVILIVDGAYTLFSQIDVLIIGAYLGASAVGIFSGPLRLITFLGYPGGAISTAVSPLMARRQNAEPSVTTFIKALRVLLIVQAAATAVVLAWAPFLVHISLGSQYKESVVVLRALAPYVFMFGFGSLVSITANYLGEARWRVPIALITIVINLALDLVLVPRIGVVGGCAGTDVAYALYAPAHLAVCQRALDLDLRGPGITLLRTLAAGAAMFGIMCIVGNPVGELWRIPVGALAGCAAYSGVLFATGEVTLTEVRLLLRRRPFIRTSCRAGAGLR
jgi:O-antigen/teichoic acid export membrane protein